MPGIKYNFGFIACTAEPTKLNTSQPSTDLCSTPFQTNTLSVTWLDITWNFNFKKLITKRRGKIPN